MLARIALGTSLTAVVLVAPAAATAPPVGPLPAGPTTRIATQSGQLIAVALPHASSGRVWRFARGGNTRVLRQVSEADVGPSVVIVYRAVGPGKTNIAYALTRGETTKAYAARFFQITVT